MKYLLFIILFCGLIFNATGSDTKNKIKENPAQPAVHQSAYFAGGCFWCMEPPYDKIEGVLSTTSGYMGGTADTATYEQVSKGKTLHREIIEVRYDANKITLEKLIEVFWQNIDFLDGQGQFCDKGFQYTAAFYYANDAEKKAYTDSLEKIKKHLKPGQKIEVALVPSSTFYKAEDYHQDYYKKNPIRYTYYRKSCARDKRLEEIKKNFDWEKIFSKEPASAKNENTRGPQTFHKVTRVVDGDTLLIEGVGRVRLIGVDTPETVHPKKKVQKFGKEASLFTKKLVENKNVRLEYDYPKHDKHKRTLAYVYLEDGTLVNSEIIRQGYGFAYTRFPFKRLDEFRELEKLARAQKTGLWADEAKTP